jgi:hypothetical protein
MVRYSREKNCRLLAIGIACSYGHGNIPPWHPSSKRIPFALHSFKYSLIVNQTEIRWRLRTVYDRQEVTEVLHHLQTEGYLQLRVGYLPASGIYAPFDDDEETEVYWFIGEKHWYQV